MDGSDTMYIQSSTFSQSEAGVSVGAWQVDELLSRAGALAGAWQIEPARSGASCLFVKPQTPLPACCTCNVLLPPLRTAVWLGP